MRCSLFNLVGQDSTKNVQFLSVPQLYGDRLRMEQHKFSLKFTDILTYHPYFSVESNAISKLEKRFKKLHIDSFLSP